MAVISATDLAGNSAEAEIRFHVDTNIFSLSGPYRGAPTLIIIGVIAAAVGFLVIARWRGRKSPPRL